MVLGKLYLHQESYLAVICGSWGDQLTVFARVTASAQNGTKCKKLAESGGCDEMLILLYNRLVPECQRLEPQVGHSSDYSNTATFDAPPQARPPGEVVASTLPSLLPSRLDNKTRWTAFIHSACWHGVTSGCRIHNRVDTRWGLGTTQRALASMFIPFAVLCANVATCKYNQTAFKLRRSVDEKRPLERN